jgi:hypothetical protein
MIEWISIEQRAPSSRVLPLLASSRGQLHINMCYYVVSYARLVKHGLSKFLLYFLGLLTPGPLRGNHMLSLYGVYPFSFLPYRLSIRIELLPFFDYLLNEPMFQGIIGPVEGQRTLVDRTDKVSFQAGLCLGDRGRGTHLARKALLFPF